MAQTVKVMSLSQLRNKLFQTFFLLRDTGAELEISYRRKVYKLSVVPTGKKVTTKYKRKKKPLALTESKCPECGGLVLNDVCMNEACVSALVVR